MRKSFKLLFGLSLILVILFNMTAYAAPQASLRFMWWGDETRHKATMAAIELYMKKNPGIKISGEYGGFAGYQQKLLTQLAGGTAADIIQIDQPWVADLMSQGDLFVNLYTAKELKLSGFDKNFLKNQCEWDGKLVGLPTGLNGLIYVANPEFMAKYKVSLNTRWDWDKLLEVGTKIHTQNKDAYLLSADVTHTGQLIKTYIKQHNGAKQFVNSDFTPGFDKAILSQAFAYYLKLQQSGTMIPLEEAVLFESKTDQNPRWGLSNVGMAQNWVSSLAQFYLGGKMKLDVMCPAIKKDAKHTGIIVRPSQLMVINKRSSNAKEAGKFLSWFFNNPEALTTLKTVRGIPPTKAGLATLQEANLLDPNMVKGLNLSVKNAGLPENDLLTNKELVIIFSEYIQKVGFKRLTPDDAADQMLKSFQNKLAELKAQK